MNAVVTRSRQRAALRSVAVAWIALVVLAGCTGGRNLAQDGNQLIAEGRVDEGLAELERVSREHPDDLPARMSLVRQRDLHLSHLLTRAESDRTADRLDEAAALVQRAATLSPEHPRVRTAQDALQAARQQRLRLDQATSALAQGRADEAARIHRAVLAEAPTHPRALALQPRIDAALATQAAQAAAAAEAAQPQTAAAQAARAALRRPITLDFRDANLKSVFEALSRSSGLNFVFDREVRSDIKVTLSIKDLSVDDVVGVLTATNQLERKRLNDNTVLIYPATPAKQKDYQDLSVRTFYLANSEAKAMLAMLKTVLKTRDLYADEKLNSLTMRDTPEAIRLAEKVIAAQDLAEPEVMLDVEVLEVKRARFSELGLDLPGKFSLLNIVKNPDTVVSTATGLTTVQNNTTTTTQLTLDRLRGISSRSIGIDNPALNLRAENGDTNILANPRIRVKNRDKAKVLIGDRVPVITTTATANVGVSESVSYLDVGLKLDVEPTVFLDSEVAVKVNLEVSNIVREVRSRSGSLTYQIGTRLATTTLRLKDGETQALAGLISDEDRRTAAGVPGLLDLPIIGRLFSTERNDRSKTEIVLLLTPRVVRNISAAAIARGAVPSGTESSTGAPTLRLRGQGRLATSSTGGAAASVANPVEDDGEAEPEVVAAPVAAPAAAAGANGGAAR